MPHARVHRPGRTLAVLLAAGSAAGATAAIRLADVAPERGLSFVHDIGAERVRALVETTGSGTCAFDADGDGDDDAFLVNGGVLDGSRPRAPNALFLNDAGRFRDAGPGAGVAGPASSWGMGCVAADFEGDGDLDLLVTAHGPDQLLLNDGAARFRDVTVAAGLADDRWNTGAAIADYDLDGDLDLYVAAYVDLGDPRAVAWCQGPGGLEVVCRPFDYAAIPNRLYRNDGPGPDGAPRFTDVTAEAGVADAAGKSLGVLFEDLTGDGRPDLLVANDTVRSSLYVNAGDGTFADRTLAAGVGLSAQGMPQASMGLDAGDLDPGGNGLLDLVVTNFQGETNTIWQGLAPGRWADATDSSGSGAASLPFLAFGVHLADLDLDGDLDLFVVNGHVDDRVHLYDPRATWAQRDQLFENRSTPGSVALAVLPADAIEAPVRAGRGSAVLDFDRDGDLDVLVSESAAPATLLENRTPRAGRHWLEVELAGNPPNPFAVGAHVFAITPDRRVQQAGIRTASSYASSSPPRAHFGLGAAASARVIVRWPDGATSTAELAADRRHRLAHPFPHPFPRTAAAAASTPDVAP